jgi:endonuclease/exonuclease/phosphatase family metal-dependent hydrolase
MLLASYNIQYCLGSDNRYDIARVARELRNADIIALQEVERFFTRSGLTDQPAELAAHFPDHYWAFGANYDMDASFRTEAGALVNRRRQFGNMVLSRWPLFSVRNLPLPKYGSVNHHIMQRGLLEAVTAPHEKPLRVYSTHLCHLSAGTRLPQVEYVKEQLRLAPETGGAWSGRHPDMQAGWAEGGVPPMPRDVVLMGDMNFAPDSAEYTSFLGPVSPHHGRIPARDGLQDAWVLSGHGEQEGTTHPQAGRIDHCFVSSSIAGAVRSANVDTDAKGSDHYPLFVELAW